MVIGQLCHHHGFSWPTLILLEGCITALFPKKINTALFTANWTRKKPGLPLLHLDKEEQKRIIQSILSRKIN